VLLIKVGAGMARIRWKLHDLLQQHGLSAYALGQKLGGTTRIPTIYRLARADEHPQRVDLNLVAEIIVALRSLTEERIELSDLLELED